MEWYVNWVTSNVLLAAFAQFAILGTAGEALGIAASRRRISPKPLEWLAKAIVWGGLGVLIKYAFTGFGGFLSALVDKGFLPTECMDVPILKAFSLSLLTNAQFGPLLMFLHRSTDNLITGTKGYEGIGKSLLTLAWFWVPAHTLTFSLQHELQIGLAALWSAALGLIMGCTKRSKDV